MQLYTSWELYEKKLHFPCFRAYQKEINFNFIIRLSPSLAFNLPSLCTRHFLLLIQDYRWGRGQPHCVLMRQWQVPFSIETGLMDWMLAPCGNSDATISHPIRPQEKMWDWGLDSNKIYAPNTLVTAIKALKLKGKKAASIETVVRNLACFFFFGGGGAICLFFCRIRG